MRKTKKKTMAVCAALVGMLAIGGVSAYFTDTESANNVFVISDKGLDITLTEHFTQNQELVAKKTIAKDPTIKLEANSVDAYIYATVTIPAEKIKLYNDSNDPIADSENTLNELFTMNNLGSGWTELTDLKVTDTDSNSVTHVFVYGNTTNPTKVEAGTSGTTLSALFESVTFANVGSKPTTATNNKLDIDVNAYAIQADNLGTTDTTAVWNIAKKAN